MVFWIVPDTAEKAANLAHVAAFAIPAQAAHALLGELVASDSLHDKLAEAEAVAPQADVRPLLAAELDLLLNWIDAKLGDGKRDTARALRSCTEAPDVDDILHAIDRLPTAASALAALSSIVGPETSAGATVEDWIPRAVYVVSSADGRIFRIDRASGSVVEAYGATRDRIAGKLRSRRAGTSR